MFNFKLLGKARVPHIKGTASLHPIKMTPPKEVCLPIDQSIGAPSTPIVKVGDEVKVGQLIATASGYVSAPIHASVSGKVVKIDTCLKSNGHPIPAIRIESDGLMTPCDDLKPCEITDLKSLLEAVGASGIVGLGGAGFPTAVKLAALESGKIHTVIINGAECEPYITCDARTMLDRAEDVYDGIQLIGKVCQSVEKYIIGIEANKPDCIKKMKETFAADEAVEIRSLPTLYPQGSEKVLIHNTTGLIVPEGKLPADVGVIVLNVTTLASISKYVKTGMPLVERCITVDGDAIKEPKNVIAPLGTSIGDLIEFAGGCSKEPAKIIHGGPMTGHSIYTTDEPVVKTTGAVIALSEEKSAEKKSTECIHCGRCVDVCPHHLNPTAFCKTREIENKDERMERLAETRVNLCVECGCCSFVCPANRPLTENIRLAKKALREYNAHKASLK